MKSWLEALKAWNAKKKGKYCIPKKGTKEYNEVRKMMGKRGGMMEPGQEELEFPANAPRPAPISADDLFGFLLEPGMMKQEKMNRILELERRHPEVRRHLRQWGHSDDEILYELEREMKGMRKEQEKAERDAKRQAKVESIVRRDPKEPGGPPRPKDIRYWFARMFGRGTEPDDKYERDESELELLQSQYNQLERDEEQLAMEMDRVGGEYGRMLMRAESDEEYDRIDQEANRVQDEMMASIRDIQAMKRNIRSEYRRVQDQIEANQRHGFMNIRKRR